jgi:hypothetical protein
MMIHNKKLNRKINFLLEADQTVPPNGIDPRMFEYPLSPKPTPATYTHTNPIGGNEESGEDDPGLPFDIQEVIDNHPGYSPELYQRFIDWVKSLTLEDIGRFGWDLIEPWGVFLAREAANNPNFDPFTFGHPTGNYPENHPDYFLPRTYEVHDGQQGPSTLPGQYQA